MCENEKYPINVRKIRISDPFILADQMSKKYYTYAAGFFPWTPGGAKKEAFYALESEDLFHWSMPVKVFDAKDTGFWADRDYWAPECHVWKGKYYLISSFRAKGTYRRCQCLVSESPKGPFVPHGQPLTPRGWHCLDGTLYTDGKGNPWLVFCHEWLQVGDGQIAAVRLAEDLTHAVSKPVILFRASDGPWTADFVGKDGAAAGYVTDGPFLHRMADGSLIMLWSSFTPSGYATGYAVSQSGEIDGPWIHEARPLYFHDGAHSMLFETFEGQLMMALHCPNEPAQKRMFLFEMEEKAGKLHVINEVTGGWYQWARGPAGKWVYQEPCAEKPRFTQE